VSASLDALRRLSAASANLLLARAEFATLELAQARDQILRWFVRAMLALALAVLTLIGASALFVVLLWPVLDWVALLLVVVAYAIAAVVVALRLRQDIGAAPPPLAETLRQLAQDRDAFNGRATMAAASHEDPDPERHARGNPL
jgi:uncharacterized membrane protein YqjE